MGTSRTANVWMAPGARPTTEVKAGRSSARAEAERLFDKPKPINDRPVIVKRAEDDADWIRADSPPEADKKDFGRKGSSGDRPQRGERAFGDKPRGERSFADKPRGDRKPREDGDRPARSFDKPRGERSFGDKPRGDRRPREDGDRPARTYSAGEGRSERPRSERPSGDRPFGDKPRGAKPAGKSFGGKPGGSKPFGGKPSGGRGKPGGSGGKPTGRPGGARTGGKPRAPRG
jgi:23S rRNA pseudouridine2605 synthase